MKTLVIGWIAALAATLATPAWNPSAFHEEDTLDFLTVGAEEGEHWSRVWLVVIGGDLYVRLGDRAARRIEANKAAPYVKVRIAKQEFDRVRVDPAPDMAEKVAAAIADKYWSEVLVRYFSHPLVARLVYEPASG